MKSATALERYLESVKYASRPLRVSPSHPPGVHRRVITISRQAGSGAHSSRTSSSRDSRIQYLQEYVHLSPQEAVGYVRKEDLGRKRYVKKYYAKDVDDPLLYHLVINTDRVSYVEAARMIAEALSPHPDASGTSAV